MSCVKVCSLVSYSDLLTYILFFILVNYFALIILSCFIGTGGLANSKPAVPPPVVSGLQRDTSQVTTLTELGKKLLEAVKVGDTNQVRRLMAIGAPFATDGVCALF